jgi:hypothetical protein
MEALKKYVTEIQDLQNKVFVKIVGVFFMMRQKLNSAFPHI